MSTNWNDVKVNAREIATQTEHDKNAHGARTEILRFSLGFKLTRWYFRALQRFGLYPRA